MNLRVCNKCQRTPVSGSQRWCSPCKREREQALLRNVPERAGSQALAPAGADQNRPRNGTSTVPAWALEEPQPFTPYRVGQPALPWYAAFLTHYATHGGKALAAAAAGVTLREVNRHLDRDPAFRSEFDEAYSYHCDLLEWESLSLGRRKGNPLPYFNRMTAEMPHRHNNRLQVSSVSITAQIPAELGAEMLRGMLQDATDATRALLPGGGAAMPALPEGESPA